MARPNCIQLFKEEPIPILYEDRAILASTSRGLDARAVLVAADEPELAGGHRFVDRGGHFWARSRGIRF